MSHLVHLIGKSIRNIAGRPLSVATSLLSLLLLFLMIDLVWISSLSSDEYFDNLAENINMEIFLGDNLPDSSIASVLDTVHSMNGVEYLFFVSKDDAREKLFSLMGTDLLEGLSVNPLPRSIVVEFENDFIKSDNLSNFEQELQKISDISEIHYAREWLEKAESSRSLIAKAVIFLSIVISLAIILNLLHGVRHSVRARQEELFQLQLLGTGRGFLSIPYIMEGFFYAAISSVLAWLIIYFGSTRISFHDIQLIFPLQSEVLYFCIIASVAGMITGYIGIKRAL